MTKGVLRFFFDYGAGGCLWAGDDATRHSLGLGPVDAACYNLQGQISRYQSLPLSEATGALITELDFEHSGYLNPIYPPDPSLWAQDLCDLFNAKIEHLLLLLRAELGEKYDILDQQIRHVQDQELEKYLTKNLELSIIYAVETPTVGWSGTKQPVSSNTKTGPLLSFKQYLIHHTIARASRGQ